jgi:hypothetical protein
MIKTKERYKRFRIVANALLGGECRAAVETIEALRPFLRLARETKIVPVGSYVTFCTLCDTSWLTDEEQDPEYPLLDYQEHHEEDCLFYGIPRWLIKDD